MRAVLDMGNGSACTMPSFYRELGIEPIVINGEMDGLFSGRGRHPQKRR